jgi:RNA polymerase sigma factor (sigma-70 family)
VASASGHELSLPLPRPVGSYILGRRKAELDGGVLYRQMAPAVLGYLRAQRVPEPEDLLGEVFLHVARDLHRLAGKDDMAVRKWVFAVARHRVIDDARRRARRPVLTSLPMPDVAAGPPDEPLDPGLIDALASLTPDQREVILLRFIGDLSLTAVARITHRRVGAVKSLQNRALAAMAEAVSKSATEAL